MRKSVSPKTKKREVLSREARIEVILEASRRVFASHPYDTILIDDIAAEASMSKGLLYHYFTNKHDLYVDTLRSVLDTLSEIPSQCADLHSCLESFLTYFEQNSALIKMFFRGGIGLDSEIEKLLVEFKQRQFAVFFGQINGSTANPLRKLALRGWIQLFHELTMQWIDANDGVSRNQLLEWLEQSLQMIIASTAQYDNE